MNGKGRSMTVAKTVTGTYDNSGISQVQRVAFPHAMELLRIASNSGKIKASKKGVQTAAALHESEQTGGFTVMSMRYLNPQEGSGPGAVTLPQAFFGRESVKCGVFAEQCGGAKNLISISDLDKAARAEGIPFTRFALDQAIASTQSWITNNLEPRIRATFPRTSKWTGSHVLKASRSYGN
jgi:hypothetical protein